MARDMYDFAKMMQPGMDGPLKMWGDWAKNWQAISTEMADYSKRSFEEGTQTLEKLMAARTIDQVMEIQSSYAKRCADDYMQQMSKVGTMYADLAKEGAKPFERLAATRK